MIDRSLTLRRPGARQRYAFTTGAIVFGVVVTTLALWAIITGNRPAAMAAGVIIGLAQMVVYVMEHGGSRRVLHPWKGAWRLYARGVILVVMMRFLAGLWQLNPRTFPRIELLAFGCGAALIWFFSMVISYTYVTGETSDERRRNAPTALLHSVAIHPTVVTLVGMGGLGTTDALSSRLLPPVFPLHSAVVFLSVATLVWVIALAHDYFVHSDDLRPRPFDWATMRPLPS
jgi:hypothetical protein